jgi:transposase
MGRKVVSEQTKWQIIAYHKISYANTSIADLLKISEHCVRNTIEKWEKTGDVKDLKRSGRPRKTTQKEDSILFRLSRMSPMASLPQLRSKWLNLDGTPKASVQTISRRLLSFKLSSHIAIEKPMLTKNNRAIRYKWCLERKNWSYN